jgi:hypothetical protein
MDSPQVHMEDYPCMQIAKEAKKSIVETLLVADRVAVVSFSSVLSQIGRFNSLECATREITEQLIVFIDDLEPPDDVSNFTEAFNTAFNVLENSTEILSYCNIPVLFLTDGKIAELNTEKKENETAGLIRHLNKCIEQLTAIGRTIIFTYRLGKDADNNVLKRVTCKTGGIWTPLNVQAVHEEGSIESELVLVMSSYNKLFTLGLGKLDNKDFDV